MVCDQCQTSMSKRSAAVNGMASRLRVRVTVTQPGLAFPSASGCAWKGASK